MESGALGITPCVSTKRMRASEPINLIINPSSACGEGGEGTPESPPSRGVHPLHSGCWWAQGVGGKAGVQPPVPPQLFLHAESPGSVYLAQTAASWSEQPPPARTHGTGAKNRPVTLHRRRGTGGDALHRSPSTLHPPPVQGQPLTMTVVSSEALAMTLSLWGHQSMSSTGAVCPVTSGWFLSTRPVCNGEGSG